MPNKVVHKIENENVLVLERIFDAPQKTVFKMYQDPDHLKHWWGPKGWELPVCKMDFRPGGTWLYCMKCVDKAQGDYFGMEAWGKAVYKKIVEPERLEYTDYFADADGNINDKLPATDVITTFTDIGGKTKLVSRGTYVSAEALKTVIDMGMLEGISQTWDRLEEYLKK